MIEEQLAPFDARPHWAKLFTMAAVAAEVALRQIAGLQELLKHYDPCGKFRNEFLNTNIYGG